MKRPSSLIMVTLIAACLTLCVYSLLGVANNTNGAPKEEFGRITFLTRKVHTSSYEFTEVFKVKDPETGKIYVVNSAGGIIEESAK
jgi:hypothetical protein